MNNRKYPISIANAARKLGVNPNVIYFRLWAGWPLEEAITTPPRKRNKREIKDKEVFEMPKKYKSFDESCMRNAKVFCDKDPEERDDLTNYTTVGGWRIIYLNHVKKGEYRFQAYNTDGRNYKTNDAIEIQCALEEIFENVCK